MTTTILALALMGAAQASDHDAAVHAELLALGLPTDLSPGAPAPELPEGAALPSRKGHASRSRGGSRSGSRSSGSRGGSRSSGASRSGSRSSGSRSSGSRSSGSRSSGSRPSGAAPRSSSKPRTSSRPPSPKRDTTTSGSRPSSSSPSRVPTSRRPNNPPSRTGAGNSRPGTRAAPNRGTPNTTRPGNRAPGVDRQGARTTPRVPQRTVPGRTMNRPEPRSATRPTGTLRNSTTSRPSRRPAHRSGDVRYSRPSHRTVRVHRNARYHAPRIWSYRPYYTRWWCHPYYRWNYATVAVVGFGFNVWAWDAYWVPPYRAGWNWVPGYWAWGYWHPGYWMPLAPTPMGYSYVNGWWEGDAYVEGYYRSEARDDWEWVDGYYLDDGTYVRGHWAPTTPPPEGYQWEPGFWDGETYVDGFYRPQWRKGFYWVAAWYGEDGIFHSGYWQPEAEQAGSVWVPGWFDGNEWVSGYWEDEQAYLDADLENWAPEEGFDDGWEEGQILDDSGQVWTDEGDGAAPPTARLVQKMTDLNGEAPLAVPVVIPDDAE